jgi:hypothetical protein
MRFGNKATRPTLTISIIYSKSPQYPREVRLSKSDPSGTDSPRSESPIPVWLPSCSPSNPPTQPPFRLQNPTSRRLRTQQPINTVTPRTAATPRPLLFSPRMRVCCTFFHPLTRGNPGGWGFLRLPVCLASLVRTLFKVSFYRHRQAAGLAAILRPTYELPTSYVSSYTTMGRAGYDLSVDKVGFFAEKAVADKEKAVGIFSMAFIGWIGLTSSRRRTSSRGLRRPLRKQRPAKRRGQT